MWHGPQERDQGRGGPVALGQQLQQLSLAAQLQISGPSASRSVLGTVEVHHTEPPQTPETKLTAAELHTMYYQDQVLRAWLGRCQLQQQGRATELGRVEYGN